MQRGERPGGANKNDGPSKKKQVAVSMSISSPFVPASRQRIQSPCSAETDFSLTIRNRPLLAFTSHTTAFPAPRDALSKPTQTYLTHKRDVVRTKRVPRGLVVAPHSWPHKDDRNQRGGPARNVHHPRAGQVKRARPKQPATELAIRQPPVLAPQPVGDSGKCQAADNDHGKDGRDKGGALRDGAQ